jgi:hypothetical protein
MEKGHIQITIDVDRNEAASLTSGARAQWLGKLAEAELSKVLPARAPLNGGTRQNRWKPYTREGLSQAFSEWATHHDGKAPSKNDWSKQRDPEGMWPRSTSDSFKEAVQLMADEDGVHLSRWAPHRNDPDHQARRAWADAQELRRLADGRVERTHRNYVLGSTVEEFAERWELTASEATALDDLLRSANPGPYCEDCFHGSGCREADMSYWQYAIEIVGGLRVRNGGDFAATRSRRAEFGRNRQMVTAGVSDVQPVLSDPAAGSVIETLDVGRH